MDCKMEKHKRYICSFQGCTASYNKQWKLDAHLCKHTGVKPHTCGHQGCGKSFWSPYHLARHELIHSGEKPFPCSIDGCNEAFSTNANRMRHVGRFHCQEVKKYVCKYENCKLEFKKNKQLKSHMCEQHSKLPPYQCTVEGCNMRFSFPSKLKRHEKVHKGYPCVESGCVFIGKTWTDFLKHRKEQHRVRLSCEQCTKMFADQWCLQQHQKVHSETRLVLKCPREDCERTFTTAFNLQSHICSFHEELRPYTCPHPGCGRSFAMKQSLTRHGVMHDPERKKIPKTQQKRSLASRLSGFKDPKTSRNPLILSSKDPKITSETSSDPVQSRLDPGLSLGLNPDPVQHQDQSQIQSLNPGVNPDPVQGAVHGSVELVSLLQDASLLCGSIVERHEQITNAFTSPLYLKC